MPLNASDLPLPELLCCAQEFDASERFVVDVYGVSVDVSIHVVCCVFRL